VLLTTALFVSVVTLGAGRTSMMQGGVARSCSSRPGWFPPASPDGPGRHGPPASQAFRRRSASTCTTFRCTISIVIPCMQRLLGQDDSLLL